MKTSLICLLLLAAVACAAPKAEEMRGGKRERISEKMREKMAEKRKEIAEKMREMAAENGEEVDVEMRKEIAEKMHEMAMEKREESEKLVAGAKSDEKAEARDHCSFYSEPCYTAYEEYGCYYNYCYNGYDELFYDSYIGCSCCSDQFSPQCYLRTYYNY